MNLGLFSNNALAMHSPLSKHPYVNIPSATFLDRTLLYSTLYINFFLYLHPYISTTMYIIIINSSLYSL